MRTSRVARAAAAITIGAVMLSALNACATRSSTGPYSPIAAGTRDAAKATQLNAEASELLEKAMASGDAAAMRKAEALLREALNADLHFGPAHNNLGVIFLSRDELYEAASEFEWARKLMPGHPDPRVNLAFTLESAGRVDGAIATYRTALEVLPDDIAAMQGLARLQVRSGKRNERTQRLLSEITMRGETPGWRGWARSEMLRWRIDE